MPYLRHAVTTMYLRNAGVHMAIKVGLVRIGNSQGIRIPKPLVKQCGFGREVELRVEGSDLIVSPSRTVRENWDGAFKRMAANRDDRSILPGELESSWDRDEWRW
jgi:antitoxin MazE